MVEQRARSQTREYIQRFAQRAIKHVKEKRVQYTAAITLGATAVGGLAGPGRAVVNELMNPEPTVASYCDTIANARDALQNGGSVSIDCPPTKDRRDIGLKLYVATPGGTSELDTSYSTNSGATIYTSEPLDDSEIASLRAGQTVEIPVDYSSLLPGWSEGFAVDLTQGPNVLRATLVYGQHETPSGGPTPERVYIPTS